MNQVSDRRTTVQVVTRRAPSLLVSRAKAVQVVSRTQERCLVAQRTISRMVSRASGGVQGPPGPRQVYNQAGAPLAVPGYTLIWFKSGVSADPNDRELMLVE